MTSQHKCIIAPKRSLFSWGVSNSDENYMYLWHQVFAFIVTIRNMFEEVLINRETSVAQYVLTCLPQRVGGRANVCSGVPLAYIGWHRSAPWPSIMMIHQLSLCSSIMTSLFQASLLFPPTIYHWLSLWWHWWRKPSFCFRYLTMNTVQKTFMDLGPFLDFITYIYGKYLWHEHLS